MPTLSISPVASESTAMPDGPGDVADVHEVHRLVAAAVDHGRVAGSEPVEEGDDHGGVVGVGRLPGAVDVEEPQAQPGELGSARVEVEHLLAGQLGHAVRRDRRELVVLAHRQLGRVAVDRRGRRVDDAPDRRTRGRVEHVLGAHQVDVQALGRVRDALVHADRGQVHDRLDARGSRSRPCARSGCRPRPPRRRPARRAPTPWPGRTGSGCRARAPASHARAGRVRRRTRCSRDRR